jgi:predicted hydrocarbon binding protein
MQHFEFDGQTGVIKDKLTGERCVIIKQARMQEIFSRLSDIFQSGAKVIFFEAGKAAGERFVEDAPEVMKADKTLFLETVVQRFMDAGLGKIEIVELNLEEAEVKFRIWNNFFAELCGEESACCSCVEGFVSGIYGRIIGKTPKIKQTKCATKGDLCCEWHMSLK